MACRKIGFTLIELSIVLVIIGLLAAGTLVGRDLIRAAELRAVISEVDKFKSAVNTFRSKYGCIPGDCPNATDFWPEDVGCPFTVGNLIPKVETCNGKGAGKINDYIGIGYYDPGSGSYYNHPQEMFRFWQQLANAGLIPGIYSGAHVDGGPFTESAVIGIDLPAAKAINGAGWLIHFWENNSYAAYDSHYANKNYLSLVVGDSGVGQTFYPMGGGYLGALNPQDAYSIDAKADDGIPYSGTIIPFNAYSINSLTTKCVSSISVPNNYLLASHEVACAPSFEAGF